MPGIFRYRAYKVPSILPINLKSSRKRGLEEVLSPSRKRIKRAFSLRCSRDSN